MVQHPLNSAELNRTMSCRDENVEAMSCIGPMSVPVGRYKPNTGRSVFDRNDGGLDEEEITWSR